MQRKGLLNFLYIAIIIFATACVPLTPGVEATATHDANNAATLTAAAFTPFVPTATLPTEPAPTAEASPTPTPAPQSGTQFLAYINSGHLWITDVTNVIQGATLRYTAVGVNDQVTDLVWSPSGEFLAFVSAATGEPHVFTIFGLGQSSPTDLGPGSSPAWSPDSQSLAYISGTFPDDNIWVTTIDNPTPRQLTFETNYAWGGPAFTPDGESLVVAGTSRDNMGASGNTTFTLEYLELDGSGIRTPIPGTLFEGGRLPYDLRFSPDGTWLTLSNSFHMSACASPGAYYVINADGSNRQELISPSLKGAIDPNQEHYHVGLSYTWSTASNALIALGNVIDCNLSGPTPGQVVAGPQMSMIGLDGSEGLIIPGFFYGLSMDRTGTLIAAAHFLNGFQDLNPTVELYSAQTGQLVLPLGPGSNPQFQP